MSLTMDTLSPEEAAVIRELRGERQRMPAAPPGEEPAPGQRRWGEFPPPNPASVTPLKDAAAIVSKQMDNFAAVGATNYLLGAQSPKADPILAGIAAQPAYEAAMRDPNVLKRRVTGLQATNMGEWITQIEQKGVNRISEGVAAARPKIERFWSAWHPRLLAHVNKVRSMPSVTAADRKNRMIANLDGLIALKGQGRS